MKTIKVSSGESEKRNLLLRQTVNSEGLWNDCRFVVNDKVEKCDWWFVLHGSGLINTESCLCDPEHIVYVSMEPSEEVSKASGSFLGQFSKLLLCDRDIIHSNIDYLNGLTWWVGIVVQKKYGQHSFSFNHTLDYDRLTLLTPSKKKNRISVILSKKDFLDGHKSRLDFLDKILDSPIAKYIDVFGHGFNPIPDKWDAIEPYKYHLVLENSVCQDYWSEKLADAFLGFSLPIYFGCPNILDYFNKDSLVLIDINKFDESIELIKTMLENGLYEERVDEINKARGKVLNEFNIFNLMSKIANSKALQLKKVTLHTNAFYKDSLIKKIVKIILSKLKSLI